MLPMMAEMRTMMQWLHKTIRGQAIRIMRDQGVVIEDEEEKMALQLFPRVSSLVHRFAKYSI